MSRHAKHFQGLVQGLRETVAQAVQFTVSYNAEVSDFIRFNHAKVRQAGQVEQATMSLKLIDDGRQAELHLTLSQDLEVDRKRLAQAVQQLRETLPLLQPDPYLQVNTAQWQTWHVDDTPLPDASAVVEQIGAAASGLDLVGIYAAGSPTVMAPWAGTRPIASTSTSACSTPTAKR
jgi:predicted Zn-dependent protease